MTASPTTDKPESDSIAAAVQSAVEKLPPPVDKVCIAFSGGMDSTVLLHAARGVVSAPKLRAAYVDHGLHKDSAQWAAACQSVCEQFGVELTVLSVDVDLQTGGGLESAARDARYEALVGQLAADEGLFLAHHQRDQLETFFLRLARGAGIHGLAAMAPVSQRGSALLIRPMLQVPAAEIRNYATAFDLEWTEDPSNSDTSLDRNFLRHEVQPLLSRRWPAIDAAVARAARLCADSAAILDEVAAQDIADGLTGQQLALAPLRQLSVERQCNALRFALRKLQLAIPSERQLREGLAVLLGARSDAAPEVSWPGVRIRRYRERLWLYAESNDPVEAVEPAHSYSWTVEQTLDLGPVRGRLEALRSQGQGFASVYADQPLEVRFRAGGEKLRTRPNGPTRDLKNLLQENDIAPWMRKHIPLIYSGDRLLAIGDLWVNADFAVGDEQEGIRVSWQDHLPLS